MKIRTAKLLRWLGRIDSVDVAEWFGVVLAVEMVGGFLGAMLGSIVHSNWAIFYGGYAIGGLFWFPLVVLALYGLWNLLYRAIEWGTNLANDVDYEDRTWAKGGRR